MKVTHYMNITMSKTVPNHPKKESGLQFIDVETQERLIAPRKRSIIIGRTDSELPVDIDTTPVGGFRKSVSRQHLQVQASSSGFFAFDVSSYGSAINGKPMQYQKPYPLSDGDQLLLGGLHLKVQINN